QREEQRLERRIGALVHPGKTGADDEREHGGAGRELQGVEKEPRVVAAQIGGAEVFERVLRRQRRCLRREKTLPKQEYERDEGKPDAQGDGGTNHHPSGIESRREPGKGSKASDRVGHRGDSCTRPSRTLIMVMMMVMVVTAMTVMMAVRMIMGMVMMMNALVRA